MADKKEEKTLNEMMKELDEHVRKLEADDISLEDSFQIYEEGMKLIKQCNAKIDRVEKKVLELNGDGTLQEME
ncbi:MAG: exodeoxyribonuclease VII small subunit [Lachnospiraceae bacterium]|nr:exodeoxyribonuclease VII small subunit [Lachnospiraceae bacterium]